MTNDHQESETFEEIWIFGGSYATKTGRRWHRWIRPDDEEVYFDSKGSYVVGCTYRVRLSCPGPDDLRMHGRGRYEPEAREVSLELCEQLQAQHRAAETAIQRKQLERKLKAEDPLADVLGRLADIAVAVPPMQRDGFAALVLRTVYRAYFQPPKN
ncbi:hypothetical protein Lesp02_02890 [Lentzea sp. NBRC 105346]|uniref:hypothetical protein n=1 Tax=Lentzea sp. NBRC 105346 TaxID=3032205 RepID=UPI0024A2D1B4|nr:hypothetical protein [Lentzea sp. NBRC 105346]GLZ28099.1 hypothetical protein Lesp02_02890 [Lentzea sp. NBRC 105346]